MTRRPKPIILTAQWLYAQRACDEQSDLAIAAFGRRVTLTRQVLHEMAELNLNIYWLAVRLLRPNARRAFHAHYCAAEFRFKNHYGIAWSNTVRIRFRRHIADRLADLLRLP